MADQRPLCFVLMPFGTKPDPTGRPAIDFDRVYGAGIQPAIEAAGLRPVRADQEKTGGIIHKPMFERLLLCEYGIADLTTANANVFYELGVRHTARPATTLPVFALHQPIPFDVNYLRALPYDLGADNRFGDSEAAAFREALTKRLTELREVAREGEGVDSPVFQLLEGWRPDLSPLSTEMFREQIEWSEKLAGQMERARLDGGGGGVEALRGLQSELGGLDSQQAEVAFELMHSYRALRAWSDIVQLYESLPESFQRQVRARQQLAFALNRRAGQEGRPEDRTRALRLLEEIEAEEGPSSETCGLLGRIHKDRWEEAREAGDRAARGHLKNSIGAYVRGFEADWREPYPGVNAATLLDVRGGRRALEQRDRLVPVVRFAVEQNLRGRKPNYWDHATLLELAVLASAEEDAEDHLDDALAAGSEGWMFGTTARNLRLLHEARSERGEDVKFVEELIDVLEQKSGD